MHVSKYYKNPISMKCYILIVFFMFSFLLVFSPFNYSTTHSCVNHPIYSPSIFLFWQSRLPKTSLWQNEPLAIIFILSSLSSISLQFSKLIDQCSGLSVQLWIQFSTTDMIISIGIFGIHSQLSMLLTLSTILK